MVTLKQEKRSILPLSYKMGQFCPIFKVWDKLIARAKTYIEDNDANLYVIKCLVVNISFSII